MTTSCWSLDWWNWCASATAARDCSRTMRIKNERMYAFRNFNEPALMVVLLSVEKTKKSSRFRIVHALKCAVCLCKQRMIVTILKTYPTNSTFLVWCAVDSRFRQLSEGIRFLAQKRFFHLSVFSVNQNVYWFFDVVQKLKNHSYSTINYKAIKRRIYIAKNRIL